MAKRNPAEQLKRYVTSLKKKTLRDGRLTHTEHGDLGSGADRWYLRNSINWLVYEWQVWASLQGYSRHPKDFVEPYRMRPLATPFAVDDSTVLYVGADELNKEWEYILVWRAGDDFGFRILGESERDEVDDLNHAMFRNMLGLRFDRIPPHGVPFRTSPVIL